MVGRPFLLALGAAALGLGLPLVLLGPLGDLGWWIAAAAVAVPVVILARRWPSTIWWAALIAAPLSVEVPLGIGQARIALPVEPLMIVAVLVSIERWWRAGWPAPGRRWCHPVVVLAVLGLVWMGITAAVGVAPVVGLKMVTVRVLQAVFVVALVWMVQRSPRALGRVALVANLSLLPVVLLAVVRVGLAGFGRAAVYTAAAPFFPNRLELTILAAFWLVAGSVHVVGRRGVWLLSLVGPAAALAVLQGRAGVIALVVGLLVRTLLLGRPRPAAVASLVMVLVLGAGALALDAARSWDRRNSSTAGPGALDPVWRGFEVDGLSGDESLLERMNRWRCAVVMAAENPATGFGPGSFERVYGPLQRASDLTSISTFAGDRGDAHSQPLGTLAEQGGVGLGLELALLGMVLWRGVRAARRTSDPSFLAVTAAWTGALAGLVVAGLVVGWSDLPATGLAGWLAIAAIVVLDTAGPRPSRGGAPVGQVS